MCYNLTDRCYDHKFMIVSRIDYDHGCVPIGWRDHWRHSATLGYDHGNCEMLLTAAKWRQWSP